MGPRRPLERERADGIMCMIAIKHRRKTIASAGSENDRRLLRGQDAEPGLVGDSCAGELVVGGETCRVRRFRQVALGVRFL